MRFAAARARDLSDVGDGRDVNARVLATDLDGTLAHGSPADRRAVIDTLRAAGIRLVYVTGRTPDAAARVVHAHDLPAPDVLLADVGTSALYGLGPRRVRDVEVALDRGWPGVAEVERRLASVEGLTPQGIEAPRRASYWIEAVRRRRADGADPFAARPPEDASFDDASARIATVVADHARRALEPLDVDVLVSANVFLDVMPHGVNKGSTLRRVLAALDAREENCIVAGDSLNDLSLFETGLRGIVVGNCEPALLQRVASMNRIYCASGIGAAGVLEGLRHFGWAGDAHGEDGKHAE